MDLINEHLANGFTSDRLYYVRVDESNEAIRSFIPQADNDPTVQALSSSLNPIPKGRVDTDRLMQLLAKALLGVAICLKPDEEHASTETPDAVHGNTLDPKGVKSRREPKIIGTMGLGWGGVTPALATNRIASLGITISRAHQNKGYGREAINWMLDWAFRYGNLHSVRITTFSYNERAVHLYQDMGFVLEGRLRESRLLNRKWYDDLLFSMLEEEWETLRQLKNT
jgi:RimJ/RimL family protein N-acetyltransferase